MDDDDEIPMSAQLGSVAELATSEDEAHPFTGWLYVPDKSSTTGWTAVEIRRPEPPQRSRHVGFRR